MGKNVESLGIFFGHIANRWELNSYTKITFSANEGEKKNQSTDTIIAAVKYLTHFKSEL